MPPPFTPGGAFGDNFGRVLDNDDANFLTGLMNSIIVSAVVTVSVVLTGSLAGFAFAKLKFRGSNALLLAIIVTMMIPTQLGAHPALGHDAGPRVVRHPATRSPCRSWSARFGVFMMRQYASQAISDELIEAGPRRRLRARSGSTGASCCPRCVPPPACSAC